MIVALETLTDSMAGVTPSIASPRSAIGMARNSALSSAESFSVRRSVASYCREFDLTCKAPVPAQCRDMESLADASTARSADSLAVTDPLWRAAAYLALYTGSSRDHARSDLRCFLEWCSARGLDPLIASRVHLELYIRWMQEGPPVQASTVSRRFLGDGRFLPHGSHRRGAGALTGRVCRQPTVPPESPTLGFTHPKCKAMLTAARESRNRADFALVAMLGPR